jgi:ribosome biogenesis GTPase A
MKKLRHKKEGMAIEQPTEVICQKNRKSFSASGKLVEMCDVIIEVLDARDPQGCRVSQL